jgi:hypothetical protein
MKKAIFIILTIITLASCGVSNPTYLYKFEPYVVIEDDSFYAKCKGKDGKILEVRNFDVHINDTIYSMQPIPVKPF